MKEARGAKRVRGRRIWNRRAVAVFAAICMAFAGLTVRLANINLNVGAAARELAFFAPFAEIMAAYGAKAAPVEAIAYYMTARPNRFVGSAGSFDKQREAIRCHKSQFPEGCGDLKSIELYLKLRAADFGLRSLKGKAEGFRVLGRTQMHCLPEA